MNGELLGHLKSAAITENQKNKNPQLLSWFNPIKVCFSLTETCAGQDTLLCGGCTGGQERGAESWSMGAGEFRGSALGLACVTSLHTPVPEPGLRATTSQGGRVGRKSIQEEGDGTRLAKPTPLPLRYGLCPSAWQLG